MLASFLKDDRRGGRIADKAAATATRVWRSTASTRPSASSTNWVPPLRYGGAFDVEVGHHAQQGWTDVDAVPARQINQAVQGSDAEASP
jgi:hypothetical protein